MSGLLHYEDFPVGHVFELGTWEVTAEEIVDFGLKWDPLPFHTDPDAPVDGPYGGLIASGRHSALIWMRLWADAVLLQSAFLGSPGIAEIKWHRPVRPGDVLTGSSTILDARSSSSRPGLGIVTIEGAVTNQDAEVATTVRVTGFFRARGA
jgi:acyl dehydratase